METLSSCYFCGTALDESVEEYPVVPDAIDSGDAPRVALCQSCHEKFDVVLEAVASAVEGSETDGETPPTDLGTGETDSETSRSDPGTGETDPLEESDDDARSGTTTDVNRPDDDGDDSGDDGTDQSLTALEYNKVMRLVQNREFPLDRAEIETVASNAYGIPRRDCARILDAAIERGLLGERDGQLLDSDE